MSARSIRSCFLTLVFTLGTFLSASHASYASSLTLYVYDSFVAQGGLGPEIFPLFEKKCGCQLRVLPSGDGGQLLSRLQIDAERGKPAAQIVLGLDEATFERARPWLEGWQGWQPEGLSDLHSDLKPMSGFLPFDYGFFAFMADRQALSEAKLSVPTQLSDLLSPQWKRNVILQDPRTSTPGLAFVLYADQVVSSRFWAQFWAKMRTQWLTLAVSWDSAYGLFLRKEAPLVWSYTTSQAYHEAHGDSAQRRYQAVLFDEGQPMQVEGAALVKGSIPEGEQGKKQRKLARDFLQFLISPAVQDLVASRQWMYPARKSAKVPASFARVPRPKKVIHLNVKADEVSGALSRWSKAVEGAF